MLEENKSLRIYDVSINLKVEAEKEEDVETILSEKLMQGDYEVVISEN